MKAALHLQVSEVISSIRQASKSVLKEESKPKQEAEESFYNSQKFEVLYCGKVTVNHKKAPSTLIDDCIDLFRQHESERRRLRLLNGQRSTEAPVVFTVGDDPLSMSLSEAALTQTNEKADSMRTALPECIQEDSGFEQQEFRTRCNSLAGGLQKMPKEPAAKVPTRRRHASAPNNVQPSDTDKNRTMLFQV